MGYCGAATIPDLQRDGELITSPLPVSVRATFTTLPSPKKPRTINRNETGCWGFQGREQLQRRCFRLVADASPRILMSSARHGRRRGLFFTLRCGRRRSRPVFAAPAPSPARLFDRDRSRESPGMIDPDGSRFLHRSRQAVRPIRWR